MLRSGTNQSHPMIHIARDGVKQGPYPLEQVNALLASGQLRPTDLSWKEGQQEWLPLSGMPGVVLSGISVPSAGTGNSLYAPPNSAVSPVYHQTGQVPPGSIQALRETRPWVLLLAILGMLGTGLMLLGGLGMLLMGASASRATGMPAGMMAGMAILYLFIAVLYLYPIIKLFKYASAISRLNHSGAASDMEDALRQQKSFWKFVGIAAILVIVVYIIVIAVVGVGAVRAASMRGPAPTTFPTAPTSP